MYNLMGYAAMTNVWPTDRLGMVHKAKSAGLTVLRGCGTEMACYFVELEHMAWLDRVLGCDVVLPWQPLAADADGPHGWNSDDQRRKCHSQRGEVAKQLHIQ